MYRKHCIFNLNNLHSVFVSAKKVYGSFFYRREFLGRLYAVRNAASALEILSNCTPDDLFRLTLT